MQIEHRSTIQSGMLKMSSVSTSLRL